MTPSIAPSRVMLERLGAEVLLATNGAEGLDQLRRLTPDLILCDLRMPGVDGIKFARRVRAQPQRRRPDPRRLVTMIDTRDALYELAAVPSPEWRAAVLRPPPRLTSAQYTPELGRVGLNRATGTSGPPRAGRASASAGSSTPTRWWRNDEGRGGPSRSGRGRRTAS
jgi:response regulator receiver domain-containing protein